MPCKIVEDCFGSLLDAQTGEKKTVRRFTFSNDNNVSVQVINYGATITTIKVPDNNGRVDDVIMGFDDIEGYTQSAIKPYFGALVGRVANRIGKGQFRIGGTEYQLSTNRGNNHLHGGFVGFDKVIWDADVTDSKVTFSLLSQDGEEGYPGHLIAHATYSLTENNQLIIKMLATATKQTPVNLTNHAYFNLAGHSSGNVGLYQHVVNINADAITAVDEESIPTGEIRQVGGTCFDLRSPRRLKEAMVEAPGGGFDHNFCVNVGTTGQQTFVARVTHPGTGRTLEVTSDQPGVQFYTANFLPSEEGQLKGKGGTNYVKHGAFCLETQNYPDAVNHVNFPSCILQPGQVYAHTVKYRFTTSK